MTTMTTTTKPPCPLCARLTQQAQYYKRMGDWASHDRVLTIKSAHMKKVHGVTA